MTMVMWFAATRHATLVLAVSCRCDSHCTLYLYIRAMCLTALAQLYTNDSSYAPRSFSSDRAASRRPQRGAVANLLHLDTYTTIRGFQLANSVIIRYYVQVSYCSISLVSATLGFRNCFEEKSDNMLQHITVYKYYRIF